MAVFKTSGVALAGRARGLLIGFENEKKFSIFLFRIGLGHGFALFVIGQDETVIVLQSNCQNNGI